MAEETPQPPKTPPSPKIEGSAILPCMICSAEEEHYLLIEQGPQNLTATTHCSKCDTEMTHPVVAVISGYLQAIRKKR